MPLMVLPLPVATLADAAAEVDVRTGRLGGISDLDKIEPDPVDETVPFAAEVPVLPKLFCCLS